MTQNRDQLVSIFGLVLVEMAHKWRRLLDARLRPEGLSQATWRTLFFASMATDGIQQKDLAIAIGIEGPSLVRLLDLLEGEGLLQRQISPGDRRGKIIRLTERGRSRVHEIQGVADGVRLELLDGISADQLGTCLHVFERIKRNADRLEAKDDRGAAPPE